MLTDIRRAENGSSSGRIREDGLSRLRQEREANIAEWSEARRGIGAGPDVVAGESDVLPAERGDVREEIVRNSDVLRTQMLHGAIEVDSVPMHDRRRDEARAGGAEALVFQAAGAHCTLA